MDTLLFTPLQLITLLGMAQALYALVYMAFRAGRLSRAGLAIIYFFVLFFCFFTDFASSFFQDYSFPHKEILSNLSWVFWIFLPSLSYLLILQIARIHETPSWRHYFILFVPILSLIMAVSIFDDRGGLYVMGLVSGAVSLLLIWLNRPILEGVQRDGKAGQARYWLIMCLIIVNVMILGSVLVLLLNMISYESWAFIRNILGLGFVYLASTSLFRIYPQAVLIKERRRLDPENHQIRETIEGLSSLLEVDHVYQEAKYSRKDFARELDVSESIISQIVNDQYQQTVPQLLNRYRIQEAKGLLQDTNASVQVISAEVGFNSITTFNRVFKGMVGVTPSEFKEQHKA